VIPNCLDTGKFYREESLRQPVRREIGITDYAIMVVIVARVDPMKNWEGVLDAVRDVPGVVTVGIGKGTDELPPQPGFIGLGWRDDVQRLLSASDIFLLASTYGEGTSMSLVEAMACSLPCVVTDVGGNGAIVGDAGLVVSPSQTSLIRDALLRLAGDKRLREQMGLAARARIAIGHSADEVAAMIELFAKSNGGTA
jgi:glycosyltransferase involved in cell wall biosynthesis